MLIHPEIYHILNSHGRPEKKKESRPAITRGARLDQSGADKSEQVRTAYDPVECERSSEVDYLNERPSNLSRYA